MRSALLLALVAPLVSAVNFTGIAENSTLSKGDTVTLTWISVDTDPKNMSIYLVNFVNFPPFYTPLALSDSGRANMNVPCAIDSPYWPSSWPPYFVPLSINLDVSAGQAKIRLPCNIDSSYGYQFNALNGTNTYNIYAQTPKFFIGGADCTNPLATIIPCNLCTCGSNTTPKPPNTNPAPVSNCSSPGPLRRH